MNQLSLLFQQISDHTITIAQGQTPLIELTNQNPTSEVSMAVNCLRSGCPSVQLLFPSVGNEIEKMANVRAILKTVTLPGEKFLIAGIAYQFKGGVQIVTRQTTV